ncbi:MAG: hypothetical protein PWP02_943 [Thermosipho sp. (in: thermotogales)]|nr:hypothetical protein [Thermosipho sp. (in: thermotogales)]
MPGFDSTGPLGKGPIGWRRGYCNYNNSRNVWVNPYVPNISSEVHFRKGFGFGYKRKFERGNGFVRGNYLRYRRGKGLGRIFCYIIYIRSKK